MALGDYFKGPEHKANAARLEVELQTHRQQTQADMEALQNKYNSLFAESQARRQQSQTDMQALQVKYDDLVVKTREIGLLDLIAVQEQTRVEHARLANVQSLIATTQYDLEATRSRLKEVQQQILGAEDTVQLESFALYQPKYQFTNSIDYKERLDQIREDQKRTARGLSAEVDAWESFAVELTKAQWKKLRITC